MPNEQRFLNSGLLPLPARDERGGGSGRGESEPHLDPPLPGPLLPQRRRGRRDNGKTLNRYVFRQTEVTEPMYGCGDLAGRICRCSGFWSRRVFGGCRRAKCARWVSPTGLRPFTLTRWTNRIGGQTRPLLGHPQRARLAARRSAGDAVADKYGSDAGRRLPGVHAHGGHRAVLSNFHERATP
jgi:hypothetical protein